MHKILFFIFAFFFSPFVKLSESPTATPGGLHFEKRCSLPLVATDVLLLMMVLVFASLCWSNTNIKHFEVYDCNVKTCEKVQRV